MNPKEFAEILIEKAIFDIDFLDARGMGDDIWPEAGRNEIDDALDYIHRARITFD